MECSSGEKGCWPFSVLLSGSLVGFRVDQGMRNLKSMKDNLSQFSY